jgi:Asp-tRNA(Asn)/Glu-tRNA(Gln) amidotransferase A subunit family amidase
MEDAVARLRRVGIAVAMRHDSTVVADVEAAITEANAISQQINDWEGRWPLNTYRERDVGKLSKLALERLTRAEAMNLDQYRGLLVRRTEIRATYARLAGECDACVTLSASGPAPVGLGATGDASYAVPCSLLGVPAISLPLFRIDGLPLGLQVTGFEHNDAAAFAAAAWIEGTLASSPAAH